MPVLPLIYAPNPVFKQQALPVEVFDDNMRRFAADMLDTMAHESAAGLGANMVGVLKRVIVAYTGEDGKSAPLAMINPVVTKASEEVHAVEEASLSFPGISAVVSRPSSVTVAYQDTEGAYYSIDAHGFLASVLQHEIDYLDGIVFLDRLSKLKRDRLLKKMTKTMVAQVCSTGCCD